MMYVFHVMALIFLMVAGFARVDKNYSEMRVWLASSAICYALFFERLLVHL